MQSNGRAVMIITSPLGGPPSVEAFFEEIFGRG